MKAIISSGETLTFGAILTAYQEGKPSPTIDINKEKKQRKALVNELMSKLNS